MHPSKGFGKGNFYEKLSSVTSLLKLVTAISAAIIWYLTDHFQAQRVLFRQMNFFQLCSREKRLGISYLKNSQNCLEKYA